MPNEISQAEIEEPITPELEGSEDASAEDSTQQQPPQEKPLTAEDYRQIAREEATRIAQSQMAKGENRINQRIAERFAALDLTKATAKLTDEQVQAFQQEIIREEQVNAYKPQGPQANGQQGQASSNEIVSQQVEFVYDQIDATFQTVGAQVTPNDPEWKTVEAALNDPRGSLAATQLAAADAARAKLQRQGSQQKKAAARVTSTGGEQNSNPNNIANITDTDQLYELGEKQLREKKRT